MLLEGQRSAHVRTSGMSYRIDNADHGVHSSVDSRTELPLHYMVLIVRAYKEAGNVWADHPGVVAEEVVVVGSASSALAIEDAVPVSFPAGSLQDRAAERRDRARRCASAYLASGRNPE